MMKLKLHSFAYAPMLAYSLVLAGCAVGPDFKQPEAPSVQGYSKEPMPAQTTSSNTADGGEQQFVSNMDIPAQWWTLFQSTPLNSVIEQALKASPDLQSAQAALRAAEEQVSVQQGAFFPTVNASLTPTRQKIATTPGQE